MQQKRKYLRITTVIPVEFIVFDKDNKKVTPWLQGFTQDISKGGLCLTVNDLWWGFWDKMKTPGSSLSLKIDLPLSKSLATTARVVWYDEEKLPDFIQYKIGLEFLYLKKKETHSLFHYALVKKAVPLGVSMVIAALLLVSFSLWLNTQVLIEKNRKLVSDYVRSSEQITNLTGLIEKDGRSNEYLKRRRDQLKASTETLEKELAERQKKYEFLQASEATDDTSRTQARVMKERISLLESELQSAQRESSYLKTKEEETSLNTANLKDRVVSLEKERLVVSEKILQGLYSWIKNRQDLIKGLVISYEGDRSLDKTCFTYDQALASIVFLIHKDRELCEKILDFYLARSVKGEEIYNAYYTHGEVAEFTVHSGPNAWIGIAALIYAKETQDKKYLPIAQNVFTMLMKMMDSEGGIRGGPKDSWYATEHNLDAYAFFTLYYEVTGDPVYQQVAEKVKAWISRFAYTRYGPPINRGKGDATIATDTYAWSVTALGPQVLLALHMDPDAILEFAIEECEVSTTFAQREKEIKVKGFDFAKFRNIARGGVVSCEWTAQMILSFEIMANFYKDKDPTKYSDYVQKAFFYSNELQKMLITSPSKSGREDPCFPYASAQAIDTGHGWRTPNGNRTGSLSSTAYFLIAYNGYNPLQGKKLKISLKDLYETKLAQDTQ